MGMFLFLTSFDGYSPRECYYMIEHSTGRRYKWVWAGYRKSDDSGPVHADVEVLENKVQRGTIEVGYHFQLVVERMDD